jgi:hypothetical protein
MIPSFMQFGASLLMQPAPTVDIVAGLQKECERAPPTPLQLSPTPSPSVLGTLASAGGAFFFAVIGWLVFAIVAIPLVAFLLTPILRMILPAQRPPQPLPSQQPRVAPLY